MRVFVLMTLIGPDDEKLSAGREYDLPPAFAKLAIEKGWARDAEPSPPKQKKVVVQEVKKTTKRPVKK